MHHKPSLPLFHHVASLPFLPSFVWENLETHQTSRAICGRQKVGTQHFVGSGLEEQEVASPAELTPAVTGKTQMPSTEGPTHPQGQVQAKPMIGDMV